MKWLYRTSFFFFGIVASFSTFGQRPGYIVKDTLYTQGYLNFGAENLGVDSVGFSHKKGLIFTYYNANELKEYGLNGKDFVSINIKGKQVFVRRLASDPTYLFLAKDGKIKEYFLERDLQLTKLDKKNFKDQLRSSLNSNPEIDELASLVNYRKNSLARIVKYANDSTNSYFPYSRFGVIAGYSIRKLRFEYRAFNPSLNGQGLMVGTFVELPIGVYTKWSTRFELTYISNKYFLHQENIYFTRDYEVQLSTFNLPVLVRYRTYGRKLMPFFDFGITLGYNFNNKIKLIETSTDPLTPGVNEYELSIIDKADLGGAIGAGLDYQLDYKRTLGLEIRYQFNIGLEGEIDHTIGSWQFLATVNF